MEGHGTKRFEVYDESSDWLPLFKWYWTAPGEQGTPENPTGRHGAYPARWIAWLSAWFHTR